MGKFGKSKILNFFLFVYSKVIDASRIFFRGVFKKIIFSKFYSFFGELRKKNNFIYFLFQYSKVISESRIFIEVFFVILMHFSKFYIFMNIYN